MRVAPAIALLFPAFLGAITEPKITTVTLTNGMKLIIEEDHDIPNVAQYLFYKIGSRNERPGTTGISHFFEHMMFNGAKKYGPKQFDIQMEKAGGQNNAYTSRDVTVYTNWFPASALRLMFDMEADRIQHLSFDPKLIESERGVVFSERQTSVDNTPFGMLREQLNATAYTAHPYQWPVVGWASDIRTWTLEDLKQHFKVGYAPNNCIMVVVGDVDTGVVVKLAKEFIEPIPRQEPPEPVRTIEPPQQGERRLTLSRPAQLPIQMISYHIPASSSQDIFAIELLGAILTEGRSSRLYRRMVDIDQVALSVSQSSQTSLDPGQWTFTVRPRAGVEPAKAEKVLLEEINRVRNSEVSAEELQKAKNQFLADFYRQMKTIAGRANLMGQYEVFLGDYRRLFTAPKDYEAVTAADILRVAKQYLTEKNRTVATLVPEVTR